MVTSDSDLQRSKCQGVRLSFSLGFPSFARPELSLTVYLMAERMWEWGARPAAAVVMCARRSWRGGLGDTALSLPACLPGGLKDTEVEGHPPGGVAGTLILAWRRPLPVWLVLTSDLALEVRHLTAVGTVDNAGFRGEHGNWPCDP